MTKQNIFILLIFFVLAGVALVFSMTTPPEQPSGQSPNNTPPASEDSRLYESDTYGISFRYPATYFATERSVGTPDMPQQAIILAEDTQENRDLFEGRNTEPREGPIAITIDIYENPQKLSPQDWIQSSTNWTLSNQQLTPTTVDNKEGLSYSWSGLYEGKSTVITNEQYAYVISTTWLLPSDPTIEDYNTVLNSLRISSETK
ncbi:MAG: hypothetical protein WEC84_03060 [Candidatus Andersenbacteria bacterium]